MSQTFFTKLDQHEKNSRLSLLGSSQGLVTVWIKGQKEKHSIKTSRFDKDHSVLILDTKSDLYPENTHLLCSFELRGMTFFSQIIFQKSAGNYSVLKFSDDLFKSERRSSFRLLTFPLYEVWAEFNLNEVYEGGKVIDLKSKTPSTTTGLFKNFLNLVGSEDESGNQALRIRVQDLSATGMAIHIGELEAQYFSKDVSFHAVRLKFSDEVINLPEVKVVYLVDYIGSDKNIKKYKAGLTFPNLPVATDDLLSKKITKLLRENDFNKDFENFLK